METNYKDVKESLLAFGKRHLACYLEYKRLYAAESVEAVMAVVKDNFSWYCQFADFADVLLAHREQFAEHKIWINTSVEIKEGVGYLLTTEGEFNAGSWDTSTINAVSRDTSTINARSRDTSTINARSWDTSTINAESQDTSTINAGSWDTSTINAVSQDTSTINAESWDTSTMIIFTSAIECQVNDRSIARYIKDNRVVFADDSMKFEKQKQG